MASLPWYLSLDLAQEEMDYWTENRELEAMHRKEASDAEWMTESYKRKSRRIRVVLDSMELRKKQLISNKRRFRGQAKRLRNRAKLSARVRNHYWMTKMANDLEVVAAEYGKQLKSWEAEEHELDMEARQHESLAISYEQRAKHELELVETYEEEETECYDIYRDIWESAW